MDLRRVDPFLNPRDKYEQEKAEYERYQRDQERERKRNERRADDKRRSRPVKTIMDNKGKLMAAGFGLAAATIAVERVQAQKKKQEEQDAYSDYSDAYDTEEEERRRRHRRRKSHVEEKPQQGFNMGQTLKEHKKSIITALVAGPVIATAVKRHQHKREEAKAQASYEDRPPQTKPPKRIEYNRRHSLAGSSSGSESYGDSEYHHFTDKTVRRGGPNDGRTAYSRRPRSVVGSDYSGPPSDVGTYAPSDTSSRYNRRDSLPPIDPYRRRDSMRPDNNYYPPPPRDFRQKVTVSYR